MNILHGVKASLRLLPIVGGLVDTRTRDHKEALTEVSLNVVLSTIPIWFGALIMLADMQNRDTYFVNLVNNMRNGELYLYSTAMLSPLYYFIFKEIREFPHFPSSRMLMLVSGLIILLSAGFFAIQKANSIFGFEQRLDEDFIFSWSWKVYLMAILIVYVAHVYKHLRETGASVISRSQTQDFVREFRDRDRGNEQ